MKKQVTAFTEKDITDKQAYIAKWKENLKSDIGNMQTILLGDEIAGSVLSYELFGETQVSYWIGKEYWGQGIATRVLLEFLKIIGKRPVYGRVAFDNIASAKILEKCGFEIVAHEKWFANARNKEIEEIVYKLSD